MVARESAQPDVVVAAGDLERKIAERSADRLDLRNERAHFARASTGAQRTAAHGLQYRSESMLIVGRLGEYFSLAEITLDPSPLREGQQCVSEVEAKIDGLLHGLASLGEVSQCRQRVLEAPDGFPMDRAGEGLGTGLL